MQEAKKGKKTQRKPREAAHPNQTQQKPRSIEERFLAKSEAKAKGEDEPDVTFQKRLEALKRDARSKLKVRSCACRPACMYHWLCPQVSRLSKHVDA